MPRYLVGVGNETMTDDGIGPRVAEAVSDRARALGFEVVLIGHDTIGLLSYFDESTSRLLFVDCVRMGRSPGEWLVFSPDDVVSRKRLDRMTTHEGDLLRIIEMARQLGTAMPPVTILGIEPVSVQPGLELSAVLRQRFGEYVQAAIEEMQRAG